MLRRIARSMTLLALGVAVVAPSGAAPTPAVTPPKTQSSPPATPKSKVSKTSARNATKNPHTAANRTAAAPRRVTVTPGVPVIHSVHRGTLTGTVTNGRGGTVAGALVRLHRAGGSSINRHVHPAFATRTDSRGNFRLGLIRAKVYKLSAGKKGVGHANRAVRVRSNSVTHVNVPLGGAAKKHKKHHHRR